MISVIVYGRNDSHGYNLHRRAALSLNAIASVLADPDDEIIFVDYNTPDQLPTFPEAISDTLTDEARARLRVIRVRPKFHRDTLGGRTRLAAVEPIARNIALRRAAPGNKWILSTNTDMVFAIEGGRSLNEIVASLPLCLHHAPRFETPEILWEALDRRQPAAAIGLLLHWGEALRLDEIVRAGPDAIFDGPGDFQLFPADVARAIGGFEEAMIHGWHVDSNFSRRMRLKLGRIAAAPRAIRGYHCGHTRDATPYHEAGSQQNDERAFVSAVNAPVAAAGAEFWGAPGRQFEEIRIEPSSSVVRALETALAAASPYAATESRLESSTHGTLDYDPGHVLPHLLNAVAHESGDVLIGYIGANEELFDLFNRAWARLDQTGKRHIAVPSEFDWLAAGTKAQVVAVPMDDMLRDADLFVCEFSAPQRLPEIVKAFDAIVAFERDRPANAAPRRILTVNAIHNEFEARVRDAMVTSLSPYSTRVRTGSVNRAADAQGRTTPADIPRSAPPPRVTQDYARSPSRRPLSLPRPFFSAEDLPPAVLRAVRAEDWGRPAWRAAVSRFFPHFSLETGRRTDVMWEAVSICEALGDRRSLLSIISESDALSAALASAGTLSYVDARHFGVASAPSDFNLGFAKLGVRGVSELDPFSAADAPAPHLFEAIVVPAETLRRVGRLRAGELLRFGASRLKPGGRMIFGAFARYARVTGMATFPTTLLDPEHGLAAAMRRHTNFVPAGPVDFRLSASTLAGVDDGGPAPQAHRPVAVTMRYGAVVARTIWVFERVEAEAPENWSSVSLALAAGWSGALSLPKSKKRR